MAAEILNGPVIGPYWVDGGDIIVVSDDAFVTSDMFNSGAIENRTATDTGISVIVDGKIKNTGDYGDGIRLVGENPGSGEVTQGDNLIQVRQDGSVSGFNGINLIWSQNNTVVVQGRVKAEFAGINVEIGRASIDISGTIRSDNSSLAMFSADGSTIFNSGRLISDNGQVFFQDTDALSISNSGVIRGKYGGITFVDGAGLSILNTGLVATTFPVSTNSIRAFELIGATGFLLENQGRIESGIAIELADSSGTIENSGKIIGQNKGFQIAASGYEADEQVTIVNSGLIKAETALYAYYGEIEVTNTGAMVGDIIASSARIDLTNSGNIIGAVKFGDLDDTYNAIEDGFVSKFVSGGDGQDLLTGGTRKDDLRGGWDNDTLRGKAGVDVLRGNAGDDVLAGGAGNDTLIGGGGRDVFVFAADSGTDRVMDFQDGKDSLRVADHSGGFAALTITDKGADLKITYDGGVILLIGEAGLVLTASDFDFV